MSRLEIILPPQLYRTQEYLKFSANALQVCNSILNKTPRIHREFYAKLGSAKIFSAMAMAMSFYKTLCVLVFLLKILLLEMRIAFWQ